MAKIVLGGGCFWGMEQFFRELEGVTDTEVGYAGGENENPTYKNHPRHAQSIEITYDEAKLSLKRLLDFFFTIHDPTTKNKQGNDIGSSYRSVIFFETDEEKQAAEAMIQAVDDSGQWKDPVVTMLEPLDAFYAAEQEHQDYLLYSPNGYTCHYQRLESYLA